jgi:hypothetical protein
MHTTYIRKIGGSFYLKLPLSYRHKFDFEDWDRFDLIPNQDGSVLKFIRAEMRTKTQTPAVKEEEPVGEQI